MKSRRVALTYHDVVAAWDRAGSGFTGPGPDRYKLDPDVFERHLDAIGTQAVELTFDDGGASALEIVAPALERRSLRGQFFVVTGRIDVAGFVTADGVRELAARGHIVGSHSVSHRILAELGEDEVEREWRESRERLEELLAARIPTASVPRGLLAPHVARAAARAGVVELYTSEPWLRPRHAHGVLLRGRLAVVETTSPEWIAAVIRGDRATLLRAKAGWGLKRWAKRAAGPVYERTRGALLSARADRGRG